MGRRPFAAVIVGLTVSLAVVAAACGSSGGPTVVRKKTTGTVEWKDCEKEQCATLSVPLDYAHPDGAHITLSLARVPAASTPIGVLVMNPGGPGASGVDILRDAPDLFPAEIRESFDIISWNPRGLGPEADGTARCTDDLDPFYAVDHDPETPAAVAQNVAAAHDFVDACRQKSAGLLPFMSTAATVRDLDAIRAAVGVDKITYVGFSYGTLIGEMYADMFPQRVRAMVLDGVVDPARSYADATIDQAKSFSDDLNAFFAHCRDDSNCAFAHGGDPAAAYDDLEGLVAQETVPGTVDGEARTLGPGELDIGVASALYSGVDGYDALADALAQLAQGDASKMLTLSDAYTGRTKGGGYSNETAVFYATSCIDGPAPKTVGAVQALAARAAKVAPYFGATTVWLGLPCTFWPAPPEGKVAPIDAPDAPPILVVGTTHDPATPYAWAQAVAQELKSARLLTSEGASHTSYSRGNQCVDDNVDHYLLELTLPEADTRCG